MKTLFDGDVEIITPCFCAGADQAKAEIRAPSIRGELRWWFRVLGGTKHQEQEIFGGIAGDEGASSAVVIRVSNLRPAPSVSLPEKLSKKPNDPFYLLYFAHAGKEDKGIRYNAEGFFAPESRFRLQIHLRRKIGSLLLKQAVEAFFYLGAIGLRSNRACGAFCDPDNLPTLSAFKGWAKTLPSSVQIGWLQSGGNPKLSANWKGAFSSASGMLKEIRGSGYSAGKSGTDPSPLGLSTLRQGSAVRLLPVQLDEGIISAVVYVPQVLGEHCADAGFSLGYFDFIELAS